jgi:HEAT repeat protein
MDDSFNLARHVARLVSLLMRQREAIDQQKLELRTLVLMTKEATLRLTTREGQLIANGLAVPSVLAGVRDLADQIVGHGVESIEISQGMNAGDLLSIARLIAEPLTSDTRSVHDRIRQLDTKTVIVVLHSATGADGQPVVEHKEPEPLQGTPERIHFVLARANRDGDTPGIAAAFEEVVFAVEQATREGRTAAAMSVFTSLIAHERDATDAEVRRHFVLAVRRLTKPKVLHPIAHALVDDAARADEAAAILARCGTDGADAVVDQYVRAATSSERETFSTALGKLPAADTSLIAMLSDGRPHVVRIAAELLALRRPADGDQALAEQLSADDPRVRRAVVRALGAYDTPFAVDALARAFDDPVVEVRLEAVAALANRKGAKVGDIIGNAIDAEQEVEVQVGMLGALGRIGTPDAVAKLAKAAEAGSVFASRKGSGVRVAAVRALAEARTAGAMSALQTLVNDKEREVRDAAVRAIGR